MSYFTRHFQSLVKFCQRRKKWEVDFASKLREQNEFTFPWKYFSNLCSLRRLKSVGCEDVYSDLFETSSVRQVFQVCFRRFPVGRDSIEVKKIIKVKFLGIIAATTGRFYEWVSVFLENAQGRFFVVPWVWLRSLSDSTMAKADLGLLQHPRWSALR